MDFGGSGVLRVDLVQHRLVEAAATKAVRAAFNGKAGNIAFFISPLRLTASRTAVMHHDQTDILNPDVVLEFSERYAGLGILTQISLADYAKGGRIRR
jgi:hypothetical protein